MAAIRIGVSGWRYPLWRGRFYPAGLRQTDELNYLGRHLDTVEINGSFHSLQRSSSYLSWRSQVPEGFVFAVKGSRFITHLRRLRDVTVPLANFFASGPLALGDALGPFLWQLPEALPFDPDRLAGFLDVLPSTTSAAVDLAELHDPRVVPEPWTGDIPDRPLRHALEVRHEGYRAPECLDLLRRHNISLVVADSAGRWPPIDEPTADFTYARLHGPEALYQGRYQDTSGLIDQWAARVRTWATAGDVFVYFDNDADGAAPSDATALVRAVTAPPM